LFNPPSLPIQKSGLPSAPNPAADLAGVFLLADFHDEAVAERRQRRQVKRLGARIVGNRKADVIDHQMLLMAGKDRPHIAGADDVF